MGDKKPKKNSSGNADAYKAKQTQHATDRADEAKKLEKKQNEKR